MARPRTWIMFLFRGGVKLSVGMFAEEGPDVRLEVPYYWNTLVELVGSKSGRFEASKMSNDPESPLSTGRSKMQWVPSKKDCIVLGEGWRTREEDRRRGRSCLMMPSLPRLAILVTCSIDNDCSTWETQPCDSKLRQTWGKRWFIKHYVGRMYQPLSDISLIVYSGFSTFLHTLSYLREFPRIPVVCMLLFLYP
jgi:hypothetical protein